MTADALTRKKKQQLPQFVLPPTTQRAPAPYRALTAATPPPKFETHKTRPPAVVPLTTDPGIAEAVGKGLRAALPLAKNFLAAVPYTIETALHTKLAKELGTKYPWQVLWEPKAPDIKQHVDVYGPHSLLHQMPDLAKYLDLNVGDERDWAVKHIFGGSMSYSKEYADLVRMRASSVNDWPKILKKYPPEGRAVLAKLALGGLMLPTQRGVFPYPPMSPPEPGETAAQHTARAMAYAADLAGKGNQDLLAFAGTTGAEVLAQVATPKALGTNVALTLGTGLVGRLAATSALGMIGGLAAGTALGAIYGVPAVVQGVREVRAGEIGQGAAHILGGGIQLAPAILGGAAGIKAGIAAGKAVKSVRALRNAAKAETTPAADLKPVEMNVPKAPEEITPEAKAEYTGKVREQLLKSKKAEQIQAESEAIRKAKETPRPQDHKHRPQGELRKEAEDEVLNHLFAHPEVEKLIQEAMQGGYTPETAATYVREKFGLVNPEEVAKKLNPYEPIQRPVNTPPQPSEDTAKAAVATMFASKGIPRSLREPIDDTYAKAVAAEMENGKVKPGRMLRYKDDVKLEIKNQIGEQAAADTQLHQKVLEAQTKGATPDEIAALVRDHVREKIASGDYKINVEAGKPKPGYKPPQPITEDEAKALVGAYAAQTAVPDELWGAVDDALRKTQRAALDDKGKLPANLRYRATHQVRKDIWEQVRQAINADTELAAKVLEKKRAGATDKQIADLIAKHVRAKLREGGYQLDVSATEPKPQAAPAPAPATAQPPEPAPQPATTEPAKPVEQPPARQPQETPAEHEERVRQYYQEDPDRVRSAQFAPEHWVLPDGRINIGQERNRQFVVEVMSKDGKAVKERIGVFPSQAEAEAAVSERMIAEWDAYHAQKGGGEGATVQAAKEQGTGEAVLRPGQAGRDQHGRGTRKGKSSERQTTAGARAQAEEVKKLFPGHNPEAGRIDIGFPWRGKTKQQNTPPATAVNVRTAREAGENIPVTPHIDPKLRSLREDQMDRMYNMEQEVQDLATKNAPPDQAAEKAAQILSEALTDSDNSPFGINDYIFAATQLKRRVIDAEHAGALKPEVAAAMRERIDQHVAKVNAQGSQAFHATYLSELPSIILNRGRAMLERVEAVVRYHADNGRPITPEGHAAINDAAKNAQQVIDTARDEYQTKVLQQITNVALPRTALRDVVKAAVRHYNTTGDVRNLPATNATNVPALNSLLDAVIEQAVLSAGKRKGQLDLDTMTDRVIELLNDPEHVVDAVSRAVELNAKRDPTAPRDWRATLHLLDQINTVIPGFREGLAKYMMTAMDTIQALDQKVEHIVYTHPAGNLGAVKRVVRGLKEMASPNGILTAGLMFAHSIAVLGTHGLEGSLVLRYGTKGPKFALLGEWVSDLAKALAAMGGNRDPLETALLAYELDPRVQKLVQIGGLRSESRFGTFKAMYGEIGTEAIARQQKIAKWMTAGSDALRILRDNMGLVNLEEVVPIVNHLYKTDYKDGFDLLDRGTPEIIREATSAAADLANLHTGTYPTRFVRDEKKKFYKRVQAVASYTLAPGLTVSRVYRDPISTLARIGDYLYKRADRQPLTVLDVYQFKRDLQQFATHVILRYGLLRAWKEISNRMGLAGPNVPRIFPWDAFFDPARSSFMQFTLPVADLHGKLRGQVSVPMPVGFMPLSRLLASVFPGRRWGEKVMSFFYNIASPELKFWMDLAVGPPAGRGGKYPPVPAVLPRIGEWAARKGGWYGYRAPRVSPYKRMSFGEWALHYAPLPISEAIGAVEDAMPAFNMRQPGRRAELSSIRPEDAGLAIAYGLTTFLFAFFGTSARTPMPVGEEIVPWGSSGKWKPRLKHH